MKSAHLSARFEISLNKPLSTYLHLEFHSAIESTIRASQPLSNFAVSNASGSSVRSPGIHSGQRMRIRDQGLYLRRKSTLAPLCSSSDVAHFLIGEDPLASLLYQAGAVGNEANSLGFR
jgi:hypothetical protein